MQIYTTGKSTYCWDATILAVSKIKSRNWTHLIDGVRARQFQYQTSSNEYLARISNLLLISQTFFLLFIQHHFSKVISCHWWISPHDIVSTLSSISCRRKFHYNFKKGLLNYFASQCGPIESSYFLRAITHVSSCYWKGLKREPFLPIYANCYALSLNSLCFERFAIMQLDRYLTSFVQWSVRLDNLWHYGIAPSLDGAESDVFISWFSFPFPHLNPATLAEIEAPARRINFKLSHTKYEPRLTTLLHQSHQQWGQESGEQKKTLSKLKPIKTKTG